MKTIETFFTSGNFDNKNITNKSNIVITQSNIDLLESDGATFELLETLGVPVFKYRTQITIHGLFPQLKNNYIGGYKNLFQNKNLSIGVKYNAIDRIKKERIFKTVRAFLGSEWGVVNNSTEYSLYKSSKCFSSKEEYLSLLPEFETLAKRINQDLYYGSVQVYLTQSYFGYYLNVGLNIGAIRNENVEVLIENICESDILTINHKIRTDKELKERKELSQKLAKEEIEKEFQEKAKPYFDSAKKYISELGYSKQTVKIYDGLIMLTKVTVNRETFDITYHFIKYFKSKAQKQFRFVNTTVVNEIPNEIEFNTYGEYKSTKSEVVGYVKTIVNVDTQLSTSNASKTIVNNSIGIKIVNYSEKSFAVIGDTKPIKDMLKSLGGKFNMYLTVGCGWIFPMTKKEKIMIELEKYI